MSLLLMAVVTLPLAGALASRLEQSAGTVGRFGTLAAGAALLLTLVLGGAVLADGPVSAVLERDDGRALAGLVADRVTVVLLALVCGVSAVVQAFARRYLRGDPRARWFFAAAGALTGATAAMVAAATLVGLAVAWTLAGVALCALLATYGELPAARDGVRRTRRAFAAGDAALWLAVFVALVAWGDLDLRRLADQAPVLTADRLATGVVASALVVAALARSAQLPLQRWLPATLAAPTPVSALLHAGVVNAGGVLLVRTAPLFGASAVATHLAFVAGAGTLLYGSVLMLAKPDVKGALAHSTMGQMGFMVMTCGLGAFAAALFHLVAHGMYKATLFLGSGSAVQRHAGASKAPPAPRLTAGLRTRVLAQAAAVPAVAVAGAAALLGLPSGGAGGTAALLVFAWASAARLGWGWLIRLPGPGGALAHVVVVSLSVSAYVALVHATVELFAPALPATVPAAVSPWALAGVLALLALTTLVRLAGAGGRLGRVQEALYVRALTAGHVVCEARPRARPALRRGWGGAGGWVPSPEGGRP